jgi:HK97 family phage portal protein
MKRKRKTIIRKPSKNALSKWGQWQEIFVSTGTKAGVTVSNDSALQISAVYACIRNISEDVAKVPIKIYRKTGDGKQKVDNHSIYNLLNYNPNPEMCAMDFRQTLTAHCLGWGNGYAEIERNIQGGIVALWPLLPKRVKPKRLDNGQIIYEVEQEDGSTKNFNPDFILHVKGYGDDGLVGHNVIQFARENLGMAKAAEMFGSTYFGNNTILGGTLTHPGNLSKPAQERLLSNIKEKHQGPEKAHNLMVLEEGMKFERMVIAPEESQFLETRQFSIPEVCRWFRMPPHKVADLNRATFSNIEHQDLEYVKDCLTAWFKRWEQAIAWKLLSEAEKSQGFYVEHTVEGLLRGDIQSRYAAYQIALGNNNNPGFMTINEVRSLENLNPIDGGDELFTPKETVEPQNNTEQQQEPSENEKLQSNS